MIRKALAAALLIMAASALSVGQTKAKVVSDLQRSGNSAHRLTTNGVTPAKTRAVKIYLVAADDAGKSGKKIGCDDSLVAVRRRVPWTAAPLKAALEELVATPRNFNEKLGNYVFGPDLKLKSAMIKRGTATIRFSGAISVAGICDQPRITEQIRATAQQFPTVKRVRVFVGDQTLKDAIK